MKYIVQSLLLLSGLLHQTSLSMVIDSFPEDNVNLSLDGQTAGSVQISGPIGASRYIDINPRMAGSGSKINCSTIGILNYLQTNIDGTRTYSDRPLHTSLQYMGQGNYYDLSAYDGLALDFSGVSGNGYILVEIDQDNSIYDPSISEIPIFSGTVIIPFSAIAIDSGSSVSSFRSLNFSFVSETDQLSFNLHEIRAVPEPGTLAFLIFGVGVIVLKKRTSPLSAQSVP